MPNSSSDKDKILAALLAHADGGFNKLDPSDYTDKCLPEAFNAMLEGVAKRNNEYLMRINDSMSEIGNSAWLKVMFEVIATQQESLKVLQGNREMYSKTVNATDKSNVSALACVKQLEANMQPCIDNTEEIEQELDNMIAEGELNQEAADKLKRLFGFNKRSLYAMQNQVDTSINELKSINDIISEQSALTKPLLENVWNLAKSCDKLSLEIFNAGHHMYSISRGIDNARNDMFRHNSQPTLHDALKVYAVDHIVLTWRLYNHMSEYEVLMITQLNNPDRCKFGVWVNQTSPAWVRETEEFKKAFDAHEELHKHAVACFIAKEATDMPTAISEFEAALGSLDVFLAALEDLHAAFRKKGIIEETPFMRYA